MSNCPKTDEEKRLEELAQRKSQEILRNISALSRDIKESQKSAKAAEEMGDGLFFGRTRKKADATAKALVLTNKTLSQMNTLIKDSIQFSCGSYRLSTLMLQQLSLLVKDGFEDCSGKIVRTDRNCTEFVNILIAEIDKFNATQSALDGQAKQIQEVLAHSDEGDRELSKQISEAAQNVRERSDHNDAIHDAQIRKLEENTASIYAISEQKDEMHERMIKQLSSNLDAVTSRMGNLESHQELIGKQNFTTVALALSIIAMALSVAALLVNILR